MKALVHRLDERAGVIVAELIERGFTVEVPRQERSATLDDLQQRAQITYVSEPDPFAYALVVNAVAHAERDRTPDSVGGSDSVVEASATNGRVTLVGGGPGDPGLLTVAGLDAIRHADVIVYDRLAPLAALAQARKTADLINVGKIPRGSSTPQEDINALLVERARAGEHVVRFKGGDNFVFGRGGEEWLACVEAGVPVDVVPGVTSAVAVPALAGIPVTHRSLSQGFCVISGHVPPGDARSSIDWGRLATSGLTIVILMGVANLNAITTELRTHGMPAATPAACVADGATTAQCSVVATLDSLARAVADAQLTPPAITIIGDVVTALTAPGRETSE